LHQTRINRPVTSREYKVMLKPGRFRDTQKGIDEIFEIIDSKIGDDEKFVKDVKEKNRRKTWYLDTVEHSLNERNKFLLRIREEEGTGGIDTTFKCRHPDRYLSASYDLSSPKNNLQTKFEEDISTPFISFPFQRRFSKIRCQILIILRI